MKYTFEVRNTSCVRNEEQCDEAREMKRNTFWCFTLCTSDSSFMSVRFGAQYYVH